MKRAKIKLYILTTTMKSFQTILAALVITTFASYGGVYHYNSSPSIEIADDNPAGIQNTITSSGISTEFPIYSVNVYLNISGGYNGDLYAYLNYGGESGTSVILLNRIGTSPWGSSTEGFGNGTSMYNNGGTIYSFMLTDSASTSVHSAPGSSGALTTAYKPDDSTTFTTAFGGSNPNSTWTIFFADMATGGGTPPSTLNSWGLEITTVPEPANIALGIFGASSMLVLVARSRTVRSRVERVKSAWANWLDAA